MNVSKKSLLVAAASALVLTSCDRAQEPTTSFSVIEASIPEMQAAMTRGEVTSKQIVEQYLARIEKYEDQLNTAVSINPNAIAQAEALDKERAEGKVRGPMHGIPVSLKDNIMTKDDMPTTGGMLAFKDYMAPYDATLVTNLKEAGAIIISKSTLSELAGWFGDDFRPGGYNGAIGQSYNPYDPRAKEDGTPILSVAGSSSGTGVAANMWAGNVGTSTAGSIEGPSNYNMLVGLRPSTGRISRHGIIPLTLDQDTAGPMTKTVAGAAIMLAAMEGSEPDPNDPRTSECRAFDDYTVVLRTDGLKGMRIGVPRTGFYEPHEFPGLAEPFEGLKPDEKQVMEDVIAVLKDAGAEVIDPTDLPSIVATDPADNIRTRNICQLAPDGEAPDDLCSNVLRYGMKRDFNLWLESLGESAPVKSLAELIEWNTAHEADGAIKYGQGRLDAAEAVDLEADRARYELNRTEDLQLSREEGIDAVLTEYNLNALIFPGTSASNIASRAGYPVMVVPFGMVNNDADEESEEKTRPYGFSFVGGHCQDPRIISIAYAFEQATMKRVPPPHTP